MRLHRHISAALALSLALSCCLPCYALAAVDGQEAANENSVYGSGAEPVGSDADSDGAAPGGDSGSVDTDSAQETVGIGEDANDGTGNTLDSSPNADTGFNASDYPAWYSDPSSNGYLGYSRDDLSQALNDFVRLSEQRELTDEENEQATLALFAWYYLGYGSPDDTLSQSGLLGNVISGITGVGDFSREDIAYTIIYTLYGSPNKWGDPAPFDYLSNIGIAGILNNIRNDTLASKNHLFNVYDRLATTNSLLDEETNYTQAMNGKLAEILTYSKNSYTRLERLYDIKVQLESWDKYVTGSYDRLERLYEIQQVLYPIKDMLADDIVPKINISTDRLARLYEIQQVLYPIKDMLADDIVPKLNISTDRLERLYEIQKLVDAISKKDFSADVTVDFLPVTERLDEIIRLLSPSGQSSVLESFVGDFDLPASSALSAQVQTALQSAFPFCIPAILKQVLGILDAEPAAAQVDFDIMGASMSLDFDAQGVSQVATVTSWLCRIFFVVLLLSCSPRFIVSLPGRGS